MVIARDRVKTQDIRGITKAIVKGVVEKEREKKGERSWIGALDRWSSLLRSRVPATRATPPHANMLLLHEQSVWVG